MSEVKITERHTNSDSEEAKNFKKKWELIIWEKTSWTIDSKVTVKSAQKLAEFLVEWWIEYWFNLAEWMKFDDEMKAILLKEWWKQLLKNLKNVDWDEVVNKKDDEDDDEEEDEEDED